MVTWSRDEVKCLNLRCYVTTCLDNENELRWATSSGIGMKKTLIVYRQMIEAFIKDNFLWMSYSAPNVAPIIPQWFGCKQFVLDVPQQFDDVHVPNHRYVRRNQSVAELNSEVQLLNPRTSSNQWVDAFGEGS
ncbi:hypothetical protein J1N35_029299 [Gossypium stocksii]|uniref:Aminotransferase-like plant mobile domain-containing protein n=1 Tax=Gossypium stocksii TaxID=47602 RepID=A0A9D3ZT71_9ROSI|nr:hypothetical protein J1N35_029299 [Gossypium stocksii]